MDETLPPLPPPLKVTVVLIAHNQAPELHRALTALERSQSRDQFEVLVVDSGSTDDAGELDQEFPSITLLRLPHHFGATKALNIAIRTSKADLLFFLSPDVEVAADTIPLLVERMEADPRITAVCPLLVDPQGKPVPKIQPLPAPENLAWTSSGEAPPYVNLDLTREAIAVEYPGRDALLVRKQFVVGMNYFDERFGEYWADADLAMKIRRTQKSIYLFPSIRATWTGAAQPSAAPNVDYTADRILGAAHYLKKHHGFIAGFRFRLSAILRALSRFDFRLFSALLGGQKVGSQAAPSRPI